MAKEKIKYNQAIEEIEDILSKLENNELDIDDLGINVKRVAQLINICMDKLKKTEVDVEKVLKELDNVDNEF